MTRLSEGTMLLPTGSSVIRNVILGLSKKTRLIRAHRVSSKADPQWMQID